ncbi:MAG: TIGR04282 family arsenosugar biosynthesis glycosyltransferase [Thermodesulfovibrionales bacterium]
MKNRHALIIFAKSPNKSPVKTRLARHLPDAQRLALYVRMLEGTVSRLRAVPGVDTWISFSPPEDAAYFERFGLPMFPQSMGDLGLRMHNALREALSRGYGRAVLVGVDIPELSGGHVLGALEALASCDVVFGPARDGGYYLVGVKRPAPEIFQGIEWSSRLTLGQSVLKARAAGYAVRQIECLDDVDRVEDLRKAGFTESSLT